MSFKDIKGQEHAFEFFCQAVNKNRLAHAYLFSGPSGLGKSLFAQNLAKFLNCINPVVKERKVAIDCCDSCTSCRKINDFNHPDVHWIKSQKQTKKISIDEVRLMQKEIALKNYEGKFKVFVIEDTESMTAEAANCLLKTLEEPPAFSVIVLTATNLDGLLPTIISRCQIIRFSPLSFERLKEILSTDYQLPSEDVHFLSSASEGRIGIALALKEQDALNKRNQIIDYACSTSRRRPTSEVFDIKDRRELTDQIGYLLKWFRDLLLFKVGLPTSAIINADRLKNLKSQTKYFNVDDLEQIIGKINEAHKLIEQNVNPKIALEVMLLGIEKCKK